MKVWGRQKRTGLYGKEVPALERLSLATRHTVHVPLSDGRVVEVVKGFTGREWFAVLTSSLEVAAVVNLVLLRWRRPVVAHGVPRAWFDHDAALSEPRQRRCGV